MANRVFSIARRETLAALMLVGAAGGLTACNSNTQPTTYRPQPAYTSPSQSCGAKTQPSQPTYVAPKQPSGGQMACGKGGKCG